MLLEHPSTAALSLLAFTLACGPQASFVCNDHEDCEGARGGGRCEDSGFCSFPDDDCPSGARYGEHAGDGLAGQCAPVGEDSETGDGDGDSDGDGDAGPAECGNGLLEDGEVCDAEDFGGLSCEALGFGEGDLTCAEDCAEIVTLQCPPAVCIENGEPCSGPADCCNSGCGKNGSFCSVDNVDVCCT